MLHPDVPGRPGDDAVRVAAQNVTRAEPPADGPHGWWVSVVIALLALSWALWRG